MKHAREDYFAHLNTYVSMAHYVAKVLHIRPNDILDTWGVPELIVAFGEYANEQTNRNYEEWKQLDTERRQAVEKPQKYMVKFVDFGDDEEDE